MRSHVVALALALLAASSANAGWYLEHEAVLPNPADMTKSIKQQLHTWHEGKKFKRESPLRNETVVIDLDKGEVYGINTTKKTYWKLPTAKYQQLALLSLVVMGVKLGPDGMPVVPDPMFAETGQMATIEGRKAFEVKVAAQLPPGVTTSLWLSKDVPVGTDQLVEQMKVSLGNPTGAAFDALFRQWAALKGYPVQNVTTIRMPNNQTITTSETLLTYREMKIPASEFAVPKGFALVTDPITELEKAAAQMQQQQPAAGIGAPLGSKPASPVTGGPR
jgi:hypothetical protein